MVDINFNYSESQLIVLMNMKFVNICGRLAQISSENLWKYTTNEGIKYQLNKSLERVFIVYYIKFDDDNAPYFRRKIITTDDKEVY